MSGGHAITKGILELAKTDEERIAVLRDFAKQGIPVLESILPLLQSHIKTELTEAEFKSRLILIFIEKWGYNPDAEMWKPYVSPMFRSTGSTVFNTCVIFTFFRLIQILLHGMEIIITKEVTSDKIFKYLQNDSLAMCIRVHEQSTGKKMPVALLERVTVLYSVI